MGSRQKRMTLLVVVGAPLVAVLVSIWLGQSDTTHDRKVAELVDRAGQWMCENEEPVMVGGVFYGTNVELYGAECR